MDKKEIIFVEVKTRTNRFFGEPAEAVTYFKLKHLLKTIKYYLHVRNLEDEPIRIDIVEVYVNNKNTQINHIKKIVD